MEDVLVLDSIQELPNDNSDPDEDGDDSEIIGVGAYNRRESQ